MPGDKTYGPSVQIARLYERVSRNGNHYLIGRFGSAKMTILKSAETTDDGVPLWNVLLQEVLPAKRPANESKTTRPVRELSYSAVDPNDPASDVPIEKPRQTQRSGFAAVDDEIPF